MAQYRVHDPEEELECPYEKSHMVRAKRFQYHLMKCRNNYTGKEFVTCPFNAKHEMPKPELRHHLTFCPDRAMLEPEMSYAAKKESEDGVYFKGCTDVPAYNHVDIPCSEDWDTESSSNPRIGVDPSFFQRVKFKDTTGMSTSQKKIIKQDWALPTDQKVMKIQQMEQERYQEGDNLRRPKAIPEMFAKTNPTIAQPQQPSVFEYSMLMAGVGRGQSAALQSNGTAAPSRGSGKAYGGRGRATTLGRGTGTVPNPGAMVNGYGNHNQSSATPHDAGQWNSLGRGRGGIIVPPEMLYSREKESSPEMIYNRDKDKVQVPPEVLYERQDPQFTAAPTPIFSMGRGRGLSLQGLSSLHPAFVVPSMKQGTLNGSGPPSKDTSEDEGAINDVEIEDAKNKSRVQTTKKLEKKFRQITALEAKIQEGYNPTPEELEKVNKKDEVLSELERLRM